MHISGKILALLVIIGWGVGLAFSSRALEVRTKWMAKAQKEEEEWKKVSEQLAKERAERDQLMATATRLTYGWERWWNDVQTQVADQRAATLQLEMGSSRGVVDKQQLWCFAPRPKDGSVPESDNPVMFIGCFRVSTLRDDMAVLSPLWRVRSAGVNWPSGLWRCRALVPSNYQNRFNDLEVQFLVADENLTAAKNQLALNQRLIASADEHIGLRMNQVNGAADLDGKGLPDEIVKGLLATLGDEEEQRNNALVEVDRLLRALKDTQDAVAAAVQSNRQLHDRLGTPTPTGPKLLTTR